MPVTKNALLRYGVIDSELCRAARMREYRVFKTDLLEKVNDALADRDFGLISQRTLEKDLQDMQKNYDVEIISECLNRRRFYMYPDTGMSISDGALKGEQKGLVEEVFNLIDKFRGAPGFESLDELIPQLESALELRPSRNKQRFSPVILGDQVHYSGARWIKQLSGAAREEKVLDIQYRPYGWDAYAVRLHPHVLKPFNGRWFCVGYDARYVPNPERGEDVQHKYRRVLALDRIESAQTVDQHLLQKEEIAQDRTYRQDLGGIAQDWMDYFGDVVGVSVPRSQKPVEIQIWFQEKRAPYVITKPLHESQRPTAPLQSFGDLIDGGYIFTYSLIPNNEFYAALLSFGPDAQVRSPVHVRNSIAEKLQQAASNYSKST
jgi:predicted DNA-binding transcriptional regulator YafY